MKGLAALKDMLARFRQAKEATESVNIQQCLKDEEEFILDLIRQDQLYNRGVNTLGIEISSYQPYAPYTKGQKASQGESPDRVTLRDTGAFHDSLYLEFSETQFEVKARDSKSKDLLDKYGEEVLGLTAKNMEKVREDVIRPYLEEQFRKRILNGTD